MKANNLLKIRKRPNKSWSVWDKN